MRTAQTEWTPPRRSVSNLVVRVRISRTSRIASAAWGQNGHAELGQGDTTPRQYPTKVVGLSNPTKVLVAFGLSHNSAVCAQDGDNVRCWGDNSAGAIGTNTTVDPILSPTAVVMQSGGILAGVKDIELGLGDFAALQSDGTIWIWGYQFTRYAANYGLTNVLAIGWAGPGSYGGPRYLTSDGVYHSAMTTWSVNCNAM